MFFLLQDEYLNAVSSDHFGEQTAIRINKGALKGMILSADLVNEWINIFSLIYTVSDQLDSIYLDADPGCLSQNLHKEEMKYPRALDS